MRVLTPLFVPLSIVCLWSSAAAAQPGRLPLTLGEAVERAVARSPTVAEARAREQAALHQADAAGALRIPSVTASAGFLRTNHVDEFGFTQPDGTRNIVFADIPSNYRARLEATIPLYIGGRDEAAADASRADARAAVSDRLAAEAEVRLAVATAYWQAVMAREAVVVRQRAMERTEAWVSDVATRVDVGLVPPNDVLSARAERARQLVELIDAGSAAALADVELAQLIGADLSTAFDLPSPVGEPDSAAEVLAAMSPAELLSEAQARRSERQGLEARAEALRSSARRSAAALRPQVAALAAVEPARPNRRFVPPVDQWDLGWDLGVNVSWTFFDGGRARAEEAAAHAQALAVAERVREFDDRLGVEVRRRQLDVESAQAALVATREGVASASEARRVVAERYAAGVATSTEVLDAEVALLDAELQHTRRQAAVRLAEARLLRTVGGR